MVAAGLALGLLLGRLSATPGERPGPAPAIRPDLWSGAARTGIPLTVFSPEARQRLSRVARGEPLR
jgi:hypothetical protein